MAPRSEITLDLIDMNRNKNSHGNHNFQRFLEFKPRIGTWASSDSWAQPKEEESSRRRVRFARSPETKEHIHVNEYTNEEKRSCWFRRSEYKAMRVHNAETVDKMRHQIPLDQQAESDFGLECQTAMESYRCHQIMKCSLLAVLEEQNDQLQYDGYVNACILAARYSSCTYEAKDRALCLGYAQSLVQ